MISFGSKRLSLATVQTARHSKLSVLAELCSLMFTTRELALCSLKGKKTNAHKNAFQKQLIDEDKVKGIIGMSPPFTTYVLRLYECYFCSNLIKLS